MELKFILESLLFAAQKPMTPRELRDLLGAAVEHSEEAKPFKKTKEDEILALLEQLEKDHAAAERSYRLACVAGSWQFVSLPEYAPWLKALMGEKVRPPRLSQPALETLAIVAYRQPLTRTEIEQIRGVSVDGVIQTLLERGLVAAVGRAEVVGRPMTYATTPLFLEYFGLRNLDELPAADELRRIVVEKPEALLTVEPGLATVPPEQLKTPAGNGAPSEAAPDSSASPAPAENVPVPPPAAEPAADPQASSH
jgi:segregation and condensation protein B